MSDANVMLGRAKSALIAHDYPLAAKIYKNLILEDPENISYKMDLGNLYVKAGKDDSALTIFQQVERSDHENLDALIAISGIYRRQKKYEESVAVLEQALVTCANDSKSRAKISYNLGFTYRQMGNYDDAINCFEEVVEDNPSDVLANNHLGAIYALKGKHEKAIEAYQRGLKFDSNHPILQFNIAKSYAEIGEKTKALSFYEGALRAKPGWTEAIEAYADLLLDENKVNEADTAVTQALELHPDDVKMLTAKGNVYNRKSIFEEAEAEFKKALDFDDEYKNALTGLAHSLENQGKVDEAVETIVKAETLNPDDVGIMKQSAHIHISANKLDTAYEKISKLQEADKNDVQTMNLLGQYYIVNDDEKMAEECFAKIKQMEPDYNEVYRDWGERFIQKGNEEKAEPYLQAAIQKNPTDAKAMVKLGELYENMNEMGKALQFYKQASVADSFNIKTKRATTRLIEGDPSLENELFEFKNNSADFDSVFSGGLLDSGMNSEISLTSNDEGFENSGSDNSFAALEASMDAITKKLQEMPKTEETPLDFNKLAESSADVDDMDSIEDFLNKSDDSLNPNHLENLNEDKKPKESSMDEFYDSELENPEQKPEISDESLNHLEDQIKKVAELTEKLNFAAEAVINVAEKLPQKEEPKLEEQIPEPEIEEPLEIASESLDDELPEENEIDSELESEFGEDELFDEETEVLPEAEDSLEDEGLEDLGDDVFESEETELADDGLLTDDDLSDDSESEDFLEDVPEALQEEETAEEFAEESEEAAAEDFAESESEDSPKLDDLTMRRAIDMLPTISASIEDRSNLYRYREYLELFKTLRDMLDFLPPSQKKEFMMSKNRVMLDFVISKLSGKPGLFATSRALIRSGLLHEKENARGQDLEGVPLAREVLDHLRSLSTTLDDPALRDALDTEALKVLEQF